MSDAGSIVKGIIIGDQIITDHEKVPKLEREYFQLLLQDQYDFDELKKSKAKE